MRYRALLLVVWVLTLLPADALARAGGGTRSFRSPSFGGGGYRGRGVGHGPHFFFFPGGGGGGGGLLLLVIIVVVVVVFLVIRARRARR